MLVFTHFRIKRVLGSESRHVLALPLSHAHFSHQIALFLLLNFHDFYHTGLNHVWITLLRLSSPDIDEIHDDLQTPPGNLPLFRPGSVTKYAGLTCNADALCAETSFHRPQIQTYTCFTSLFRTANTFICLLRFLTLFPVHSTCVNAFKTHLPSFTTAIHTKRD